MNNMQKQQNKGKYSETEIKIIEEYCDNELYILKKICDPIIFKKGVPQMYHDDLYALAVDTLDDSVKRYDATKDCQFKTFLTGNIKRTFYDWTRDNTRWKRCNLQTNEEGNIVKDENNNPIIIPNISIDAPTDDGIDLSEKVASSFKVEDELSEEIGLSSNDKIEKYLEKLSKVQRQIVLFLSDGYSQEDIRELLHISKKEYSDNMLTIRAYENVKILY
ncbi:hypothetical protein [Konateibacter massiliensis]|uniref:hypothetical protein n=1 Tax=Konateibacter massiliensis TaxID=2002841 RepID=UPI000C15B0E6|nr:hypothetical protein [Konateibacter massiliensis]